MSIQAIPGINFINDSHRCHIHMLDFVVASSAVGAYFPIYHGNQVGSFAPHIVNNCPQYPSVEFAGHSSRKSLSIIPHDILTNVFVNDTRSGPIPYLVKPSMPVISGCTTGAMAETLEGFAQAMFTRYYEENLDKIIQCHGKRKDNGWPAVLQFGSVIRDAMSHGGEIHMFPGVPSITYFGISYSSADNGRKVLHNDLSCADIFFLMLDMDSAF